MKPIGKGLEAFLRTSSAFSLLLLGIVISTATAKAQSPGTFTATGSVTTPRAGHTATLLNNGKVLIAGGASLTAFIASAELYDPSTRTFTATGNMTTARVHASATLLPDGRVLIAGGSAGPGSNTASAELYDPSTGAFTVTGNMTTPHSGHTATLLRDGRVLIAGEEPIVELYDPATGTFAVTGSYAGTYTSPFVETATLLPDGRVLITGCDCRFATAPLAELYDPGNGTFSLTGTLSGAVGWWDNVNTATLLMNGKVLLEGNSENDGLPAQAEVYDPSTGTFTGVGNTTAPHEFSTATLLPDGTVLIVGGQLPGGNGASGTDLYAPATGTFDAVGNMTTARYEHTATLLPDSTVLIAGGYSSYGIWPAPTSSAELYSPPVLVPAPVLFSVSGDGQGQGAIEHVDTYEIASPDHPAAVGEALAVYCTGLADGGVVPPEITIGGRMAEILFFGDLPGFTDLGQVNVRVPDGVVQGSAVPVRLIYLGRLSNEVTIAVR